MQVQSYKYVFNVKSELKDLSLDQLGYILPSHFSLLGEDRVSIVIEHNDEHDEKQVRYELQRECDRIFFLTGIQADPELRQIERPDGSKRGGIEKGFIIRGFVPLPSDLKRQQWTPTLEIQLRLWQLAHLPNLPLSVQVILLFQIIEASYSEKSAYPDYTNDSIAPDPLTESKLLRDWVSHQLKSKMYNDELKRYCKFLGFREEFFDPTNMNHLQILQKRFEVIKNEAEKIINASITRKS